MFRSFVRKIVSTTSSRVSSGVCSCSKPLPEGFAECNCPVGIRIWSLAFSLGSSCVGSGIEWWLNGVEILSCCSYLQPLWLEKLSRRKFNIRSWLCELRGGLKERSDDFRENAAHTLRQYYFRVFPFSESLFWLTRPMYAAYSTPFLSVLRIRLRSNFPCNGPCHLRIRRPSAKPPRPITSIRLCLSLHVNYC